MQGVARLHLRYSKAIANKRSFCELEYQPMPTQHARVWFAQK